jgi:serine/threonine-protein kinase
MSCPPAETLLEFAAGSLPDDASAKIEAHIDDCAECRGALSNLARGDAPPSFGRYRIDTVLGSGGMGIVYRAWDPQLARPIAIKVVRRGGEDTQGRARLVREAQALARLSHPNVCHVYDVGTDGDEVWVAMELIDGVSLRQWADNTRTREQLLDVLLGAANGIAAAHEAGLVHRDVKPENVLITRDGRAIVTDFGLARTEDRIDPNASTLSNDPHLTATGAIAGTPAYIAPEQLTGDPIDARVDQFAWAVMAWELLVGARPFPIIFAARIEAVQNGLKPPESLPKHIATTLVKALSYVSRDRFTSMREVIDAMRATPAAAVAKPERTISRGPAIAGLVVLGATGIAVGAWVFARGPKKAQATISQPEPAPAPSPAPSPPPQVPPVVQPAPQPAVVQEPAPQPTVAPAPAPVAKSVAKTVVKTPKQPDPTKPPPQQQESVAQQNAAAVAAVRSSQSARQVMSSSHYYRNGMIGSMDMECTIPVDPAHVTGRLFGVADWGKVISVQDEIGTFQDEAITETVITVRGTRRDYRFDADFLDEHVDATVGEWLAVCPEDESNLYQLQGGATWRTHSIITMSGPPHVAEIAKFDPIHVMEIRMVAEGLQGKFKSIDPSRNYLIHGKVQKADGARWQMDRYYMEVPAGVHGASLIATGKSLWFVISHPRFEEDAAGKKTLVVDAAYVLDELFP